MATIGIDARFYGSIGKGLGRYTQKLIENLEQIDHENNYVVFLRRENFEEFSPKNKNFRKVLADFRWYSFAEQLRFPRVIKKERIDLMHFPHFNVPLLYRKQFVLTLHDLILIHFPTLRNTTLNPLFYWIKYAAYKLAIGSAIRRSRKIFAVSNFTKNDILKNYPKIEDKILVTYEASDRPEKSDKNDDEILRNHGIIKPYLLYVGNAYPHKNLEKLIMSLDSVKKKFDNIQLVLVGKEDYFYNRLKSFCHKKNYDNVVFTGFVSDDDLDVLYRESLLYVFPSLYEGFGLPPLEAMSRGLPVLSSNHECMKEVLGDAACFVDCKNAEILGNKICEFLENKELQEEMRSKGFEQVKKYSWKDMTEKTLQIYLKEI